MSDPTASFVVTAHDQTAAALQSADRGLKRLQSTARSMRSLFASFGVVLSARAFAGWISGALDAKKMTDEQIEATREARAALTQMKAASDDLARSLATSLAPAMTMVARIAVGLNAAFFNADPSPLGKEIEDLRDKIASFEKTHGTDTGIGYRVYSKADEARIAELKKQLIDLQQKSLDLILGGQDTLKEFDLGAIGAKKTEVMRSMPDFDVNAPSEAMQRRAVQITESMQTELEKQLATMHEADALFARGLLSPETMQRMQDSMLQPIEVTAKRMKDSNAERLQDLLQTFKSETVLEQEHYAARLQALQELYDAELVQRDEFYALKEQLETEHQGRMTEIERTAAEDRARLTEAEWIGKADTITGNLIEITGMLATHSKKAFNLNKLAAISEAVINMYRGISVGVAQGFPMGIPAVAWAAAKGAAAIAAIKATTFQGGGYGTTPSAAGTPTVNSVPVAQDRVVTVRGIKPTDVFTGRALIEVFNEAIKDGAKLVLAP